MRRINKVLSLALSLVMVLSLVTITVPREQTKAEASTVSKLRQLVKTNGELKILEISPNTQRTLDVSKLAEAIGVFEEKIELTWMPMTQYIATSTPVNGNYDIIFISDAQTKASSSIKARAGNWTYSGYTTGNTIYKPNLSGYNNLGTLQSYNDASSVANRYNQYAKSNDITSLKAAQIEEFAESGQLVVFDSNIVNDSSRNTVGSNIAKLYQKLVNDDKTAKAIAGKDNNTNKYLGASCNVQQFYDNIVSMYESVNSRAKINITNNDDIKYFDGVHYSDINATNVTANYYYSSVAGDELFIAFNVEALDSGSYVADFYFDINADGLFTKDSSGVFKAKELVQTINNIEVNDENSVYSFAPSIPDYFTGVLPWKIEVINVDTGVITTTYGTIAYVGDDINVRVLQVTPNSNKNVFSVGKTGGTIDKLFSKLEGYNFEISTVTKDQFENMYNDANFTLNGNYDMLLLGFADTYGGDNFNKNTERLLSDIEAFISTGQAVMFTHDTVSYYPNYDGLGNRFRELIGQYCFNSGRSFISTDTTMPTLAAQFGGTQQSVLRTRPYSESSSKTYPDSRKSNANTTLQNEETTQTYKINSGIVTGYPYSLGDNINVANTHYQYYVLDLEDPEVIVWYTLNPTNSNSPIDKYDAANYYYTYSKGNVTFSGTGHSSIGDHLHDEIKLFVNTIVKATRSANHAPTLKVHYSESAAPSSNIVYFTKPSTWYGTPVVFAYESYSTAGSTITYTNTNSLNNLTNNAPEMLPVPGETDKYYYVLNDEWTARNVIVAENNTFSNNTGIITINGERLISKTGSSYGLSDYSMYNDDTVTDVVKISSSADKFELKFTANDIDFADNFLFGKIWKDSNNNGKIDAGEKVSIVYENATKLVNGIKNTEKELLVADFFVGEATEGELSFLLWDAQGAETVTKVKLQKVDEPVLKVDLSPAGALEGDEIRDYSIQDYPLFSTNLGITLSTKSITTAIKNVTVMNSYYSGTTKTKLSDIFMNSGFTTTQLSYSDTAAEDLKTILASGVKILVPESAPSSETIPFSGYKFEKKLIVKDGAAGATNKKVFDLVSQVTYTNYAGTVASNKKQIATNTFTVAKGMMDIVVKSDVGTLIPNADVKIYEYDTVTKLKGALVYSGKTDSYGRYIAQKKTAADKFLKTGDYYIEASESGRTSYKVTRLDYQNPTAKEILVLDTLAISIKAKNILGLYTEQLYISDKTPFEVEVELAMVTKMDYYEFRLVGTRMGIEVNYDIALPTDGATYNYKVEGDKIIFPDGVTPNADGSATVIKLVMTPSDDVLSVDGSVIEIKPKDIKVKAAGTSLLVEREAVAGKPLYNIIDKTPPEITSKTKSNADETVVKAGDANKIVYAMIIPDICQFDTPSANSYVHFTNYNKGGAKDVILNNLDKNHIGSWTKEIMNNGAQSALQTIYNGLSNLFPKDTTATNNRFKNDVDIAPGWNVIIVVDEAGNISTLRIWRLKVVMPDVT